MRDSKPRPSFMLGLLPRTLPASTSIGFTAHPGLENTSLLSPDDQAIADMVAAINAALECKNYQATWLAPRAQPKNGQPEKIEACKQLELQRLARKARDLKDRAFYSIQKSAFAPLFSKFSKENFEASAASLEQMQALRAAAPSAAELHTAVAAGAVGVAKKEKRDAALLQLDVLEEKNKAALKLKHFSLWHLWQTEKRRVAAAEAAAAKAEAEEWDMADNSDTTNTSFFLMPNP